MSHDSSPYTTGFSENPDYDYEIRATLGLSVEGASDPGEVLAATAGIKKGDHEPGSTPGPTLLSAPLPPRRPPRPRGTESAPRKASCGHPPTSASPSTRSAHWSTLPASPPHSRRSKPPGTPSLTKARQRSSVSTSPTRPPLSPVTSSGKARTGPALRPRSSQLTGATGRSPLSGRPACRRR